MLKNHVDGEGLKIMQSSDKYRHDYRGVPKIVAAGLEDITHLKHYPRYPMYSGLMSIPARFTYKSNPEDPSTINIRVRKLNNLSTIVNDRGICEEIINQTKKIQSQTNNWVKELYSQK